MIKFRSFGNDLMKEEEGARDNGQREMVFLWLSYPECLARDNLLTNIKCVREAVLVNFVWGGHTNNHHHLTWQSQKLRPLSAEEM